jgi:hypothetical protein
MRKRHLILAAIALLPVLIVVILVAMRGETFDEQCEERGSTYNPSAAAAKATGVKLSPASSRDEKIAIAFGDGTGSKIRTIALKTDSSVFLPTPAEGIVVDREGDLVREDGTEILRAAPTGHYFVDSQGRTLQICTKVERAKSAPGRYQGSIAVSGKGIEPQSIPMIVTLKDRNKTWPVLAVVGGVLLGIALRLISDVEKEVQSPSQSGGGSSSGDITFVALEAYAKRRWVVLALSLLVGALLAIFAFSQIYADNPVYGAEGAKAHLNLFIATLAAEAGGLTTVDGIASAFKAFTK